MPSYYPIFLDIKGKRCVVVGGGEVALRKVNALLEHGASVTVISPGLCPELALLAGSRKIRTIRRDYRKGDIEKAAIAIAATDDRQTNLSVSEEARESAVLVNVVDDAGNSDFIVPSSLSRGDITIAVSTAGKSPALARKIRTHIEAEIGDEFASLTAIISEVRLELKRLGIHVDSEDWQEAIDLDLMVNLLKKGNSEKVRAILLDNLKAAAK